MEDLIRKIGNIEVSYPGIAIGYELWALESVLDVMETHLPQIRDQYRLRAKHTAWSDTSLVDEEISDRFQQIEQIANDVLPQHVRNPGVVGIWALLESAVEEIADFLAMKEGINVSFASAKGRTFRKRFRWYFAEVLGLEVKLTEMEWTTIGHLQKFRHVLVHRNGRIDTGSGKKRKEYERLAVITSGVTLVRNRLVFLPKYLDHALGSVRKCISILNSLVAERYDWAHLIKEKSI